MTQQATKRLTLDHVVYAVPDLARAVDDFEGRLGSTPVLGGRHEGLGTHNAILPLAGETYLELIASDPASPTPNLPRPFGLDALHGSQLVAWVVRSRDIEADVARSRERGYDPGIVLAMKRKEPSGETLEWKLSLRAKPLADGLLPFVIDWGDAKHPSEVSTVACVRCTLSSFTAHHPDPQPIRHALDALGVELAVGEGATSRLTARLTGPTGYIDFD